MTGQSKRNPRKTSAPATDTTKEQNPEPTPVPVNTGKKNSRPAPENVAGEIKSDDSQKHDIFVYEFSQPAFTISHIRIEHDERGIGKITFQKKDFDDEFTDPVQLSVATLEKLKTHFETLNFLDSSENYQYEKDYSHLGNMKVTLSSKEGKSRTAAYNWTNNVEAKAITDEYRKLANQYIWMFDVTVARQNQPLETPRLMSALNSYLKRDGISDPPQLIPFLKELSEDERVPLIARNNAAKLIKEIEKKKAN